MAEAVAYKTYYVWVVAQKDEFAESLVSKLVRRGFTIGPLGRQLITKYEDNPACIIALSLHRIPRNDQERKDYTALKLHEEVCDVIKLIKGKFWGLIVSSASDCTWNVGNISLQKEEADIFEAAKKVN